MDIHEDHTFQTSYSSLSFQNVGLFYKLSLMWLNAAIPILAMIVVTSAVITTHKEFLDILSVAILEAITLALPYLWASKYSSDIRIVHFAGFAIHICYGIYLFLFLRSNVYPFVLLTFSITALFLRYQNLYRSHSLTASNVAAFSIDSISMFCIVIYYYVWLVPTGNVTQTSVNALFVPWMLFTTLVRLYTLWHLERIQAHTGKLSSRNLWMLFVIVILIILLERQFLFNFILEIITGLAMVLTSPLLYLAPHFNLSSALKKISSMMRKNASHPTKMPSYTSTSSQHIWLIHITEYGIIALITFLIVYLYFKWKSTPEPHNFQPDPDAPEVITRSLRPSSDILFLSTKNPVRLRAQEWMRAKFRRGDIKPTETWRRMTSNEKSPDIVALRSEYEYERYGQNS